MNLDGDRFGRLHVGGVDGRDAGVCAGAHSASRDAVEKDHGGRISRAGGKIDSLNGQRKAFHGARGDARGQDCFDRGPTGDGDYGRRRFCGVGDARCSHVDCVRRWRGGRGGIDAPGGNRATRRPGAPCSGHGALKAPTDACVRGASNRGEELLRDGSASRWREKGILRGDCYGDGANRNRDGNYGCGASRGIGVADSSEDYRIHCRYRCRRKIIDCP